MVILIQQRIVNKFHDTHTGTDDRDHKQVFNMLDNPCCMQWIACIKDKLSNFFEKDS